MRYVKIVCASKYIDGGVGSLPCQGSGGSREVEGKIRGGYGNER